MLTYERPVQLGERMARALRRRLLVVDDDDDVRFGFQCHLGAAGFDVVACSRGAHALSMARSLTADGVILDLGLPDLPGLEVLRRLRIVKPRLPIVVVSAWSESKWESTAIEAGAQLYFEKPVVPSQLQAALESLMP